MGSNRMMHSSKDSPSLSYNRKASFSSCCMASASSSIRNRAARVQNSSNSIWPLPSSSTSATISFNIFSSSWCPNIPRMVPTMVTLMKPFFSWSKASKAFLSTEQKTKQKKQTPRKWFRVREKKNETFWVFFFSTFQFEKRSIGYRSCQQPANKHALVSIKSSGAINFEHGSKNLNKAIESVPRATNKLATQRET